MKILTSLVGGLLNSSRKAIAKRQRQQAAAAASAASIVERAGRTMAFAGTDGFAQLEARQLMFGLTILPPLNPLTGNQDIAGTNLSFNPANFLQLPNQPIGNGASATARFGYLIPFLTKNIQAFQQFTTGGENFDQMVDPAPTTEGFRLFVGDNPLLFSGDYNNQFATPPGNLTRQGFVQFNTGAAASQAGTLRLSYRDIPVTATALQLPAFKTPAPPMPGDPTSGMGVVITNIGASQHAFDFLSPGGNSRGMAAARINLYTNNVFGGGGPGDIDFAVSQIRMMFQGRDVTADFQVTAGPVLPIPAVVPLIRNIFITRAPGADPFAFFDTIVFSKIDSLDLGTTDTIHINEIEGVFPPGRFATFNSDRIFGARVDVTGSQLFGVEQFDNHRIGLIGSNRYSLLNNDGSQALFTQAGISSRLVVSRNAGNAPTIVNSTSALAPANGAVVNSGLAFSLAGTNTVDLQFLPLGGVAQTPRTMTVFSFSAGSGLTEALSQGTQIQVFRNGVVVPWRLTDGRTVSTLNSDTLAMLNFNFPGQNGEFRNNSLQGAANFQYTLRNDQGFDTVRLSRSADAPVGADDIQLDNIIALFPNAYIQDLYGRGLRNTINVGAIPGGTGGQSVEVDMNDDGIPDWNDGIGRISLTGVTSAAISGGTIAVVNEVNTYIPANTVSGFGGLFETAGFGLLMTDNHTTGSRTTLMQVPNPGTVIIGSPYVRDPRTPTLYHGVNTNSAAANAWVSSAPQARPVGNPVGNLGGIALPAGAFNAANATNRRVTINPGGTTNMNFTTALLENNRNTNGTPASDPLNPLLLAAPGPQEGMGIYVEAIDGVAQAFNSLLVHGTVFGTIRFSAAVGTVNLNGFMPGNLDVRGDIGVLTIGSVVGGFANTSSATPNDAYIRTLSAMTFGRAVGQVFIAGGNFATINILGNLNDPSLGRLDFLRYTELESVFPNDPPDPTLPIAQFLGNLIGARRGATAGAGAFRNDGFESAEYVGGPNRSVVIDGRLGLRDGVNTGEDLSDAYAFSAGSGGEVILNVVFRDPPPPPPPGAQGRGAVYARVYDSNRRLVATHQYPFDRPQDSLQEGVTTARFRFTPDRTDVYYLVLTGGGDTQNGTTDTAIDYTATIQGLLPTVVGSITNGAAGAGTGTINISGGDVGIIRTGVGYWGSDGVLRTGANESFLTVEEALDFTAVRNISYSFPGSLFSFLAGGDIDRLNLTIGGDLGTLRTNFLNLALGAGDWANGTLDVGGQIGLLDIRGGLAYHVVDTAARPAGPSQAPSVNGRAVIFRTGLNGGPGHIGGLLIGTVINGAQFRLQTSDYSIVDRFEVGTVPGAGVTANLHGRVLLLQPDLIMGTGSDIRFANLDTPTPFPFGGVSGRNTIGSTGTTINEDARQIITSTRPLNVEDDNGTRYTISITGATSTAEVRLIPVVNSRGSVVARIDVILAAGATLNIIGTSPGTLAIGVINIQGTNINVNISGGLTEIDVLRLNITGTANRITNSTRNGDIVAIDTGGLNTLVIAGDLGRTQYAGQGTATPGIGERNFAPFLGISDGGAGAVAVGAPLSFTAASINVPGGSIGTRYTTGNINVPVIWQTTQGQPTTLEDVGAPFDGFLNGVVVREGNINLVRVNGVMGDVLAPGGILRSLIVNADGVTVPGGFDGIVGNIYAIAIVTIDIGDGLAAPGDTPFPVASIMADITIGTISGGTRVRNPQIRGLIIAAGDGIQGIGLISLSSGKFDGAFIGAAPFDAYWRSPRFGGNNADIGDNLIGNGTVGRINGVGVDMYRTRIIGQAINTITLSGGVWDASSASAEGRPSATPPLPGNIGSITAARYINSTLDGDALDYLPNIIRASGNVLSITTVGTDPTMSDFNLDIDGGVQGTIQAKNITRGNFAVRNRINQIVVGNDLRSTKIVAGGITTATFGGDIRSSTFDIAGPIGLIQATGAITSTFISSTGPDGRIQTISAGTDINAQIFSSGPITTIRATRGDFNGSVTTDNALTGTLSNITTGRDILGNFQIAKDITSISAARHIGNRTLIDINTATTPDSINIFGSISTMRAGGQLYSDIRVGQSILGSISIGSLGRNYAKPGGVGADIIGDGAIVAFGRIASVTITGDFGGRILSHSGGIGSVSVTGGSVRRGPSGLPAIEARDGDITSISISGGSLFGDVVARDGSIGSMSISGSGAFGNAGINPNLSDATTIVGDANRNQLPPGYAPTAGIDGPTIRAGRDINSLTISGSAFELGVYAGRVLGSVSIAGSLISDAATDAVGATRTRASYLAAGTEVRSVNITGRAQGVLILSGIARNNADFTPAFGADNLPGGIGADADILQQGKIGTVTIGGGGALVANTNTVAINAGVSAGSDGLYTTNDGDGSELAAPGRSTIGSVTVSGLVSTAVGSQVTVKADTAITTISRTAVDVPRSLANASASTFNDATLPVGSQVIPLTGVNTVLVGQGIRVRATGTNIELGWDSVSSRLIVRSTIAAGAAFNVTRAVNLSSLTIEADPGAPAPSLNNFNIVTGDDVSIGSLTISLPVTGASSLYIDGNLTTLTSRNVQTLSIWTIGGDLSTATIGNAGVAPASNSLRFAANSGVSVTLIGGLSTLASTSTFTFTWNLGTFTSRAGTFTGRLNVGGDLTSFSTTGALFETATVRSAGSIGTVLVGSTFRGFISARDNITTVSVSGNMVESGIYSGHDLGSDGFFSADDITTNGNITSVAISGQMTQSDVAAGIRRGPDAFFGTADDITSLGISSIGTVRATGGIIPTGLQSQSYRVISNGTVGLVYSGTTLITAPLGNFEVERVTTDVNPFRVTSLVVSESSRVFTALITFSADINPNTIVNAVNSALRIVEVRSVGTEIPLVGTGVNPDYVVTYNAASRTVRVVFNTTVTSRNLASNRPGADQRTNLPGPGVFRFTIDSSVFRSVNQDGLIDGNNDGVPGDSYVFATVVGDAGDKLTAATGSGGGMPLSLYGPASLDIMLSADGRAGSLPATGITYIVRGTLGDHQDTSVSGFNQGSDVDLYTITLRAGQIIRLGGMSGAASAAINGILIASGVQAGLSAVATGRVQTLPAPTVAPGTANPDRDFLVLQTGQYVIFVSRPNPPANATPPENINTAAASNTAPVAGQVGQYTFTVLLQSDNNSSFAGSIMSETLGAPISVPVDAGFAVAATNRPVLSLVSTAAPVFFNFTYDLGVDGIAGFNTALNANDDFVTGTNGFVTTVRTAGADNTFGTADDVITNTRVQAAGVLGGAGGNTAANANLPTPADFPTGNEVVNRAAVAGPQFVFRYNTGTDGVRGNNGAVNDDFIIGTNGGTVIMRQAGADLTLGNGDDVVSVFDNRPMQVQNVAAGQFPAPFPSLANFPSAGTTQTVQLFDNSNFVWTLQLGANGQRDPLGTAAANDDIVFGTNGRYTVTITAGVDNNFNTGDDVVTTALFGAPLATGTGVGQEAATAPLPLERNFPTTATVSVASTIVGGRPFVFSYSYGPDGYRGIHNGVNDDIITGTNPPIGQPTGPVTVTRTAGLDHLFITADDIFTPNRVVLSALPIGQTAPVPADFVTPTSLVTRTSNLGDVFTFRLRSGATSAQDIIVGTDGFVTIIRKPGLDNTLGTPDDIVTTADATAVATDIVTPPRPADFANLAPGATAAQITAALNSAARLPFIDIGPWRFTLQPGVNGTFNGNGAGVTRTDDFVAGTTSTGQRIEYRPGATGVFLGTTNGDVVTVFDSIGKLVNGVATDITSDIDIYNLNAGQPIVAGRKYRVTFKTVELGANFGRLDPARTNFGNNIGTRITDNRGFVQLGLFESGRANSAGSGQLVASLDKVSFVGGPANTVLAQNGNTRYGYNADGDLYMEFVVPPAQNATVATTENGIFSIYVQGVNQAEYGLEIVDLGASTQLVNRVQNIFIETNGGAINWLTPNNSVTPLKAYDPSVNGFNGTINGRSIIDYMLTGDAARNQPGLVRSLQNIFFGTPTSIFGADATAVRISTSAADFAGEQYSTIFLANNFEPTATFNNDTFGQVQRSDAFNASATDQGVVFMPSLNALGNRSDLNGLDGFIRNLTTIVGRQIGQLMGLRIAGAENPAGVPLTANVMADAGIPALLPTFGAPATDPSVSGTGPRFTNASRGLAGTGSTNSGTQFFLGQQNSAILLNRIFGRG